MREEKGVLCICQSGAVEVCYIELVYIEKVILQPAGLRVYMLCAEAVLRGGL